MKYGKGRETIMQIEMAISGLTTLGPGNRFVLWVNGCNKRCPGCVSERLQRFNPDNEEDVVLFLNEYEFNETDGVTISGGEPFEQVEDLLIMVKYFKEKGIDDILIYTGYTMKELLDKHDKRIEAILSEIAVLIDGPYNAELNFDIGNLKGSENQRIYFMNEQLKEKYDEYYSDKRVMQEVQIDNYLIAVGIPDRQYIKKFKS